jgi:hypothetical protein
VSRRRRIRVIQADPPRAPARMSARVTPGAGLASGAPPTSRSRRWAGRVVGVVGGAAAGRAARRAGRMRLRVPRPPNRAMVPLALRPA